MKQNWKRKRKKKKENQERKVRWKSSTEEPGVGAQACNPSTRDAEAGGSLQVQCQPELHRETLSQEDKKKTKKQRW